MANSYPVGDVVRLSSAFTASNVATDPSTIALYIKGPNIGTLLFTYALGQIVRDGVGLYHYDFTVPASGQYYYRFLAGGTVIAAAENTFTGGPSWFA